MAKQPTSNDRQLEIAMSGWTSVNRRENPVEWQKWFEFRRDNLGSDLQTDNFTVPTPFPPMTRDAIGSYIDAVNLSRKCVGWNGQKGTPAPHSERPLLWWLLPPYVWHPKWKKDEIPASELPVYMKYLAAKRKQNAEGWGPNDRYGIWTDWSNKPILARPEAAE